MRMAAVVVVLVLSGVLLDAGAPAKTIAASPLSIAVTSSSDTVASPACPDVSRCTLRKAIETANLDLVASSVTITFSATAFPPASPAVLQLAATPLPVATRSDLTVDGRNAGVRIIGAATVPTPSVDGLVLTGARSRVFGIGIAHFTGVCLKLTGVDAVVGGDRTTGQGNSIGDCSTAIRVEGAGARVSGNSIGFAFDGIVAAAVQTGVVATASNSTIGDDGQGAGYQNRIGNAQTGVVTGGAGTAALPGIRVVGNSFGLAADGSDAPVGTAIRILAPVAAAQVSANSVTNAQTGIAVQGSATGPSAQGVTMTANVFARIGRHSIDLNEDGLTNPNDDGDPDLGANGLRNSPRFTRVVQARISGVACSGCQVQLYLAAHTAGGAVDYGTAPVPGGVIQADATGGFTFETPAVTPGQWVTALSTDPQGNTSEFSPGSRVGAGSVVCGNGTLEPGWNLVGYFGAEPVSLGGSFPADGADAGKVRAIYHLEPGTTAYTRWLADATFARTLASLQPGEAYWFLADAPVALSGGFSLSAPIPVQLRAGWNTIVYIGASAAVPDAFASLGANYTEAYTWGAAAGSWSSYSAEGAPRWAQGFTDAQACRAYQLRATADVVLVPLQP